MLSTAIKYDPDVKGILLDNSEYVITQYADDSTLTLDNNPESLNKALFLIKIFGECSGLKANFAKTQAVWIGEKRGCGEEIRTVEPIIWNHEGKFKLLGIKYELLNADHFSVNFNEKLQSVQTLLSDWSLRNLSLVGKVTVVKTLAFHILVQILTVLPNPSMQVLKRFQTVFFNFIWNGKIDKVKREILINDYDEGGLKVPDIFSHCKEHVASVLWYIGIHRHTAGKVLRPIMPKKSNGLCSLGYSRVNVFSK